MTFDSIRCMWFMHSWTMTNHYFGSADQIRKCSFGVRNKNNNYSMGMTDDIYILAHINWSRQRLDTDQKRAANDNKAKWIQGDFNELPFSLKTQIFLEITEKCGYQKIQTKMFYRWRVLVQYTNGCVMCMRGDWLYKQVSWRMFCGREIGEFYY